MVTRRKPKTTQNNDPVKNEDVATNTGSETTGEKTPAPVAEKKQPEVKKEPEQVIVPRRRVWPD